MIAKIALEDGSVFTGRSIGSTGEAGAEVVFCTAMSGYQEVFTDPSYHGQIVVMTQPHIGNYGVNPEDEESDRLYLSGVVMKEGARRPSNFRSTQSLDEYLKARKIVGIQGVDTRAITKLLRIEGSLQGIISTEDTDHASLVEKARAVPSLVGRDLVSPVTAPRIERWEEGFHTPWAFSTFEENARGLRVVAMDFGMKYNIARILAGIGFEVWRVPANTSAEDIMALNPDGLFLSNGPGDPSGVPYAIETIKALYPKLPTFGICLGHQLLCLAMGGERRKLKFGHHGANHPVMNLRTKKVDISSQNHCFVIDLQKVGAQIEETYRNLNDQSVEGIAHRELPLFSVQFHPEASPGPNDFSFLFDDFVRLVRDKKPLVN